MSPRPRKHRHCSCPFRSGEETVFKPAGIPMVELEKITLRHDKVEAVLLCDMEGLTQEEAGKMMGVSRGTVQRLVTSGRLKVTSAIAGGKALIIESAETVTGENDRHGI
ncbi:MAG: DUF134 domain-containing protein [bacterium]|nr:DUF134 domain-containing protein [bacterium]